MDPRSSVQRHVYSRNDTASLPGVVLGNLNKILPCKHGRAHAVVQVPVPTLIKAPESLAVAVGINDEPAS